MGFIVLIDAREINQGFLLLQNDGYHPEPSGMEKAEIFDSSREARSFMEKHVLGRFPRMIINTLLFDNSPLNAPLLLAGHEAFVRELLILTENT